MAIHSRGKSCEGPAKCAKKLALASQSPPNIEHLQAAVLQQMTEIVAEMRRIRREIHAAEARQVEAIAALRCRL